MFTLNVIHPRYPLIRHNAMTIYVINPNASSAMTHQLEIENIGLGGSSKLMFVNCTQSPESIEGYSDGAKATFYLMKMIEDIEAKKETSQRTPEGGAFP